MQTNTYLCQTLRKLLKYRLLRNALVLSLTGLFMYSASIQEIHYLFVHHDAEYDHQCDHHIHSQSSHDNCSICKLVLSSFVQTFDQFDQPKVEFAVDRNVYELHEALFSRQSSAVSLRGPPALA